LTVCPFCGSAAVVADPVTHALVCTECAAVLEYEYAHSYSEAKYSAVVYSPGRHGQSGAAEVSMSPRAARRAAEIMAKLLEAEGVDPRSPEAEEAVRAALSSGRVSLRALKRALRAVSAGAAGREEEVVREIVRVISEEGLQVSPAEVVEAAMRFKRFWAGRKASTLARAFIYMVLRQRGIEYRVDRRVRAFAEALLSLQGVAGLKGPHIVGVPTGPEGSKC